MVLVGLEPEEECPILFLRLRKAYRKRQACTVYAVAPFASRGLSKLGATVLPTAPGDEAGVLGASERAARRRCGQPGAILFVGERLASVRGGLSAAARAGRADRRQARLGAAAGR